MRRIAESRQQNPAFAHESVQRRADLVYISLQSAGKIRIKLPACASKVHQTMNCNYLRPAASLLMLCLLVACAQPAPSMTTPAASGSGECNAPGAQFAIGRSADATLVEEARQRSGARTARVIRPGQAVTLEFSPQRLNLDIDAGNLVTQARCG